MRREQARRRKGASTALLVAVLTRAIGAASDLLPHGTSCPVGTWVAERSGWLWSWRSTMLAPEGERGIVLDAQSVGDGEVRGQPGHGLLR